MVEDTQIAAFEGGALRVLDATVAGNESVLALPFVRLLAKMVRVPAGEDAVTVATPILQAMSPYPDSQLTVSCETVRSTENGSLVLAAALPEDSADDIANALDAAKRSVVRIDALELGLLRGAWSQLGEGGRRVVLMPQQADVSLLVLDDDAPAFLRGFPRAAELKREVCLSLIEAEGFAGPKNVTEIIVVRSDETEPLAGADALAAFAPVREVVLGNDAALAGVAARSEDADALNLLPASWREVLDETRFKAKCLKNLAIAGGVWLLALGVLFGVPMAYGFMTGHQKELCREHARAYRAVSDKKAKTELVMRYSDHARGALELMKAVSDRLPGDVERLTSWEYKNGEYLSFKGESESSAAVYTFKDELTALAGDGDEADRVFTSVKLGPLNSQRDGRQKFDIECRFGEVEE